MFDKIKEIFEHQLNIDDSLLTRETSFSDDLYLDSMDIIELTVTIREEFGLSAVPVADFAKLRTIGDLADFISEKTG